MKRATRIGRFKAAAGVAVLCALALSAVAASSASAKGLTAFTCVTDPSGTLKGDHCLTEGSGSPAKHVKFTEKTTGIATNANTASETTAARKSILKGTLSGVASEIECTGVTGEGTIENKTTVPETGEMYVHVIGKLKYTGCKMLKPAGCTVATELETNQLTGTTEGIQTAEGPHTGLIKPAGETPFIEIKTTGCTNEGLNQTYPVTGSLKGILTGATVTSAHNDITTQNTLKFGGQKAGLDGALTLKAHKFPKEGETVEETKPLSVTTE